MDTKPAFAACPGLSWNDVWPTIIIAVVCWISIVVCIDPAGSYPKLPEGPGLTVDEFFNVTQGVYLTEQARRLGWLNLIPGTSQEAYRPENGNGYNPDHPPLGRWWLGIHHLVTWWIAPPDQPKDFFVIACARTGSATAFALTIVLIGTSVTQWYGRAAGLMSAVSLICMPRVYGHAHLASLETITNLTCTAAVLGVAHWWNHTRPPTRKAAILAGVLLGLAMLTKIQAVLVLVPIMLWTLWRWRTKAIVPLTLWGAAALAIFFVGWPYLWYQSFNHFCEYFGRTTNRATIYVWYFSAKYPDRLVPWHYPFVIFGLTVPVILQGLGLLAVCQLFLHRHQTDLNQVSVDQSGGRKAINDESRGEVAVKAKSTRDRDVLFLAAVLFPLILFALPGIAVYDCERLFLTSFPFWAIFMGRGWVTLWSLLSRLTHSNAFSTAIFAVMLALAGFPLITTAPCHLCYYNEVVSLMMGGADRAGLEIDYWGEGITRRLLTQLAEKVPQRATIAVIPTLHQFQASDYVRQSPILRSHQLKVVELRDPGSSQEFLLVFRRRADLPEKWNQLKPVEALGSTVIDGCQLAYFIERSQ